MLSTPKEPISFEPQQHSVAQQAQVLSTQQGSLSQLQLHCLLFIVSPQVGCFQLSQRVLEGFLQHTHDLESKFFHAHSFRVQ